MSETIGPLAKWLYGYQFAVEPTFEDQVKFHDALLARAQQHDTAYAALAETLNGILDLARETEGECESCEEIRMDAANVLAKYAPVEEAV